MAGSFSTYCVLTVPGGSRLEVVLTAEAVRACPRGALASGTAGKIRDAAVHAYVVLADASSITRIVQAANFIATSATFAATLEAAGQSLAGIVDAAWQIDSATEVARSIDAHLSCTTEGRITFTLTIGGPRGVGSTLRPRNIADTRSLTAAARAGRAIVVALHCWTAVVHHAATPSLAGL